MTYFCIIFNFNSILFSLKTFEYRVWHGASIFVLERKSFNSDLPEKIPVMLLLWLQYLNRCHRELQLPLLEHISSAMLRTMLLQTHMASLPVNVLPLTYRCSCSVMSFNMPYSCPLQIKYKTGIKFIFALTVHSPYCDSIYYKINGWKILHRNTHLKYGIQTSQQGTTHLGTYCLLTHPNTTWNGGWPISFHCHSTSSTSSERKYIYT